MQVPAVILICRNSTDTSFFQRLRPYPRIMLRRGNARFKDYDKTPIGFGVAVFCIAKGSCRCASVPLCILLVLQECLVCLYRTAPESYRCHMTQACLGIQLDGKCHGARCSPHSYAAGSCLRDFMMGLQAWGSPTSPLTKPSCRHRHSMIFWSGSRSTLRSINEIIGEGASVMLGNASAKPPPTCMGHS